MNDSDSRLAGGGELSARLDNALAESRRLRVEHRKAFDSLCGAIDAFSEIALGTAVTSHAARTRRWNPRRI